MTSMGEFGAAETCPRVAKSYLYNLLPVVPLNKVFQQARVPVLDGRTGYTSRGEYCPQKMPVRTHLPFAHATELALPEKK